MSCKLAAQDVETENLTWNSLGGSTTSPITQRPAAQPAPPGKSPTAEKSSPAATTNIGDQDSEGVKRRIAELESKHKIELEQVRQASLEQGLKQGRQQSAAEMEAALDKLGRTIQEVVQIKRRVRTEAENELVKLSLAIARRILHREVTADPQSLRGVVYAALQRLQNRDITRVRVFPAAVSTIKSALEKNGGLSAIEVVGDGLLPPGGLLIETSLGELDASVETQLQEIERGFTDKLQMR